MNLQKVKGYNKLSKDQQQLFEKVYVKHMAVIEKKENWIPTAVKWDKSYLKVTFKNGEWLHYTHNEDWY